MTSAEHGNRVRARRTAIGLSQAELAARAGISRTSVTAIENARMSPSVAAALALAHALDCTVEALFGSLPAATDAPIWAWTPSSSGAACWQALIGGKVVHYPAGWGPMLTPLPDGHFADGEMGEAAASATRPGDTLVLACCDPAAGLLASRYALAAGLRLLVIERSSKQAAQMLREGVVHLAGLHLSTDDDPDANARFVRETLPGKHQLLRIARWQEGIVASPRAKIRSAAQAAKSRLTWVGREPGSGARQCLDRLLPARSRVKRIARRHRGVAEAVQSGWADAGVCVQLAGVEAGLDFLPVQEEAYDVCFPSTFADDHRIKAFIKVVRSAAYRRMLAALPGYDSSETGEQSAVN